MKKIYLGHPLSTRGEFDDSKRVAKRIRELGYELYVASENLQINDKSNDPSVLDIYNGDISQLLSSDIAVFNVAATSYDGTISEIGAVGGWNEANKLHPIKIVGYTSNARLLQPQFHKKIPSASANHLVLGFIEKWGEFVGTEDNMIEKLKELL